MADADELLARVIELRECLGVENALSDLPKFEPAVFEAELSGIAEAAQHDRCTPSNPRAVSKQDLVNIARDAYCGRR